MDSVISLEAIVGAPRIPCCPHLKPGGQRGDAPRKPLAKLVLGAWNPGGPDGRNTPPKTEESEVQKAFVLSEAETERHRYSQRQRDKTPRQTVAILNLT